MSNSNPVRSDTAEMEICFVKFVGGAAAVTKVEGEGVTVTRAGIGLVDLAFSEFAGAGKFLGVVGHAFQATVPGDVKAYILSVGVYNTATRTLRLNLNELIPPAVATLTDLAALEWLNVTIAFKRATI